MMSASRVLPDSQQNAALGELLDLVGDDRRLAGADRLQEVAVGDEGDALPPWPVIRREMRVDVVVGAKIGADRRQQLLLHGLGLG